MSKMFIGLGVESCVEGERRHHQNCLLIVETGKIFFLESPQKVIDSVAKMCTDDSYGCAHVDEYEIFPVQRREVAFDDDDNADDDDRERGGDLLSLFIREMSYFTHHEENDEDEICHDDGYAWKDPRSDFAVAYFDQSEIIQKEIASDFFCERPLFSETDITYDLCDVPQEMIDKYQLMSMETIEINRRVIIKGIEKRLHPEGGSRGFSSSLSPDLDTAMEEITQRAR